MTWLMCHMSCGNPSVVTISVDDGRYLGHYPACALHIVEVANRVRQQNGMSVGPQLEACLVERRGLMIQMREVIDRARRANRPFTFDEFEMWERWWKRFDALDNQIRGLTPTQQAIDVRDVPAIESGGA